MEDPMWIGFPVLGYAAAIVSIGVGIRSLVTGRARPQALQRFGSVRRVGLLNLCRGGGFALLATGALLRGWPRVTLLVLAVAIVLLLRFEFTRGRRGHERERADTGQLE